MRLAVIGLGIGQVHARLISKMPGVELVGVCDLDQDRATKIATECGTTAYTDWQAMVDEARPDAVSLCTNPKSHLPLGKALAERGVHVLCEKPMAPDVAQCLALTEACEQAGVVLMVAQKKRFAPAVNFIKQHVGGDFGKALSLNYRYHLGQVPLNWFWQEDDGGGPLLENAIHCFDTLRYAIGEIKTIRALGGNLLNPEREGQLDIGLGLLEFDNGTIGTVELGTASEWIVADEELFIGCEKAVVRWRGGFDRPSEISWVDRKDQKPQTVCMDYEGEQGSRDFVAEITHFVECIQTGKAPLITGRDAARSVACCLAMKQAVREGTVVEVQKP